MIFKFSPRMWRCFLFKKRKISLSEVFSTYVEMFPTLSLHGLRQQSFLHVCGGVSQPAAVSATACGFLHIRGGVSLQGVCKPRNGAFSPHTWRCFFGRPCAARYYKIFSTYVGVFPTSQCLTELGWDFLRLSNPGIKYEVQFSHRI